MAVEPRELKNDNETGELFIRPKCFHNTKTGVVIMLYGVCENGNYFGAKLGFGDTHILNTNVAEFFPAAFWRLVSLDEVKEIDILELPAMKAMNAENN